MRSVQWLAAVLAATFTAACQAPVSPPPAEQAPPGSSGDGLARIVGALDFAVLPEASGLAVSPQDPSRLWFVNDQGNPAELVSVTVPDMTTRRVTVARARNRDWEDLAVFTLDGRTWLAIADVGDNDAIRRSVSLYFVPEPLAGDTTTAEALALTFRYDDGPRDVEAVAVDVSRDAIYLLSKRTAPPLLYRLPLRGAMAAAARGDSAIARRLGPVTSIPAPTALELRLFPKYGRYRNQPTGMDLSADGRHIALLTYGEAYIVPLDPAASWLEALNRTLRPVGMPVLAQAETIAWAPDGGLYVSSERQGAPLLHWPPDDDGPTGN